jgi:hypothetical protein
MEIQTFWSKLSPVVAVSCLENYNGLWYINAKGKARLRLPFQPQEQMTEHTRKATHRLYVQTQGRRAISNHKWS